MTDQPVAIPMGVGTEDRTATRSAVWQAGVIACPTHQDGVVTPNGSLYRCDYNHLLQPPGPPEPSTGEAGHESHERA